MGAGPRRSRDRRVTVIGGGGQPINGHPRGTPEDGLGETCGSVGAGLCSHPSLPFISAWLSGSGGTEETLGGRTGAYALRKRSPFRWVLEPGAVMVWPWQLEGLGRDRSQLAAPYAASTLRWAIWSLAGVRFGAVVRGPLNNVTIGVSDDVLHTLTLGCQATSELLIGSASSDSEGRVGALAADPPLPLFEVRLNARFGHHSVLRQNDEGGRNTVAPAGALWPLPLGDGAVPVRGPAAKSHAQANHAYTQNQV